MNGDLKKVINLVRSSKYHKNIFGRWHQIDNDIVTVEANQYVLMIDEQAFLSFALYKKSILLIPTAWMI